MNVFGKGLRLMKSLLKNQRSSANSHADRVFVDDAIDHLLASVESGALVVKLEDFGGAFEFDVHSSILRNILLTGQYEHAILSVVREHINRDKDVIDVGANVGLFSVFFAETINAERKVLSIEPTPGALHFLKNNIERNRCSDKVLVYEGVVAGAPGIYELNTIAGLEEYSSIGKIVHEYVAEKDSLKIQVDGATVDSLVSRFGLHPGFMKIDTEGSEFGVLLGAVETLAEFHPVIVSELAEGFLREQGSNCQEVYSLLRRFKYIIRDVRTMSPVDGPMRGNVLAVPGI